LVIKVIEKINWKKMAGKIKMATKHEFSIAQTIFILYANQFKLEIWKESLTKNSAEELYF
jgi:hypothetical protein